MEPRPDDERPPIGFLVVRIAEAVDRAFESALAEVGISQRQLRVLVLVDRAPGLSQRTLARLLEIDAGNLVAVLDALERVGLLTRARDPNDRRKRLVTLTPEGADVLGRARRATGAIDEGIVAPLPPSERDAYRDATLAIYRDLAPSKRR